MGIFRLFVAYKDLKSRSLAVDADEIDALKEQVDDLAYQILAERALTLDDVLIKAQIVDEWVLPEMLQHDDIAEVLSPIVSLIYDLRSLNSGVLQVNVSVPGQNSSQPVD